MIVTGVLLRTIVHEAMQRTPLHHDCTQYVKGTITYLTAARCQNVMASYAFNSFYLFIVHIKILIASEQWFSID